MKPKHPRWGRANWGALVGSVLLHGLIGLIAVLGLPHWSKPLPASPVVINASLVESPTAALRAREAAEQQAREEKERQRRQEIERQERIERERIAEQKRVREAAEAKARAEAERKQREEAERIAREKAAEKARAEAQEQARIEAERKAKAAAAEKARKEAEQRARAEAERKAREKAEAERKAKAAAERRAREQKAREAAFADALQAEQDAMDRNSWGNRLGAHIQRFWVRPAGANADFSCEVRIRQSRYGDVLARSIVRTCGNDFLDNSVLEAVDEASPLPLPRNPRVFEEVVDIVFVPF